MKAPAKMLKAASAGKSSVAFRAPVSSARSAMWGGSKASNVTIARNPASCAESVIRVLLGEHTDSSGRAGVEIDPHIEKVFNHPCDRHRPRCRSLKPWPRLPGPDADDPKRALRRYRKIKRYPQDVPALLAV